MPLFFTVLFFFHTIHYRTSHHTNFFYMMRQVFMSEAEVVLYGSHHIVVMRLGQARF